jgi:CheY-like chemotaxis protein
MECILKILVLDDDQNRLDQFKQRLIGHVVCCVKTAPETIQKLSGEPWEVLFLDHDLGGTTYASSGPGTGYEVAKWLSEHKDHKPNQIIIHSFNAPGSRNMKSVLPEAFYNPGAWINRDMGFVDTKLEQPAQPKVDFFGSGLIY